MEEGRKYRFFEGEKTLCGRQVVWANLIQSDWDDYLFHCRTYNNMFIIIMIIIRQVKI